MTERADADILYEDSRFVIANKRIGESVQDDKYGTGSLISTLSARYGGELYLTHRIDKPVSGVVVLARSPAAQTGLQQLFADRAIDKRYWAVVDSEPPARAGTVESWVFFDTRQNKSFVFDRKPTKKESLARGSKLAKLEYRVVGSSDRYWFLEIRLLSGRHHQIRAQLAHIGCRIKGDLKYGSKRSDPGGGIHLHARSIEFTDPTSGNLIRAVADPPDDALWRLFLDIEKGQATKGE
jgi:23S rRNA pseudouridine1911/1915/1917 synthase